MPDGRGLTTRRLSGVLALLVVLGALALLTWGMRELLTVPPRAAPTLAETGQSGPRLPVLDRSGFNPGDIISDDIFFDSGAIDEDGVRAFITSWNAGCVTGTDGTPCLADWREDTPDRAADEWCPGGYEGAPGQDAAAIITRTATSCRINPKVLIVLLQKEQGLITATGSGLTESRYRHATGYGCPDGAECSGRFEGFSQQVWYAARQFRIYRGAPERYGYRAGADVRIAYNPDPECGGAVVHIENAATAGLYAYTPYQPNEAALAGEPGDACSTWGNLNFHSWWKAWFGPLH